jgi:hypothetical protein
MIAMSTSFSSISYRPSCWCDGRMFNSKNAILPMSTSFLQYLRGTRWPFHPAHDQLGNPLRCCSWHASSGLQRSVVLKHIFGSHREKGPIVCAHHGLLDALKSQEGVSVVGKLAVYVHRDKAPVVFEALGHWF